MFGSKSKPKKPESEEEEFEVPEFHVDPELDDEARLQVLIERFVKYRLPAIIEMRDEVENGGRLSDGEIELLDRMITRMHSFNRFVHEYPDYEDLVAKLIELYDEIVLRAVDNEQNADR